MAVTGYIFEITKDTFSGRSHALGLIGFADTQEQAIDKANEQAFLLGLTEQQIKTELQEDNVCYSIIGVGPSYHHGCSTKIEVRSVSVADALNRILARAKR